MKDIVEIARDHAVSAGKKASGAIIVDGNHIGDTIQCCHCGQHFLYIGGSGRIRGYCTVCKSITCGKSSCNICIPYEKSIEYDEKKLSMGERIQAEHKRKSIILLGD